MAEPAVKTFDKELQRYLRHRHATNGTAYSTSNVTTDRTVDADSTSTAELADVLCTLIADLQEAGVIN